MPSKMLDARPNWRSSIDLHKMPPGIDLQSYAYIFLGRLIFLQRQ